MFKTAVMLGLLVGAPAAVSAQQSPEEPSKAETTPNVVDAKPLSGSLVQSGPEEETVQLGEPISVRYDVVHPPNSEVVFPDEYESQRWELLDLDIETVESEKEWKTFGDATFAIFRPGETTLPPFQIELVSADARGSLTTEPVTVKVLSALEKVEGEPEFSEPRPPVTVWVEDHRAIWAAGIGATGILLGLLFVGWRRREPEEETWVAPRPPHEVALERLGELAADDLVERGEYMIFYVRLSETIREFLGRSHSFKAVEMTTTEILEALDEVRYSWPPSLARDDVRSFLLHCDAVKFGGMVPSAELADQRLRNAFSIVEALKPQAIVRSETREEPEEKSVEESVEEREVEARSPWAPPEVNEAPVVDREPEPAEPTAAGSEEAEAVEPAKPAEPAEPTPAGDHEAPEADEAAPRSPKSEPSESSDGE